MTLYERYIDGQTNQVYQEMLDLGEDVFLPAHWPDVDGVLTEMFERVAYNLGVIYAELENIDYHFRKECKYNFERPLHKPLPDTAILLQKLDEAVKPFGFVPLSLKYFYKIVGGVNFGWHYDTNDDLLWQMTDPIQVASLDSVVEMVTDEYLDEEMQEIILAADVYHKDNISGGPAYALELIKRPGIDSLLLNEPHEEMFINYLRICFDNCGFPLIAESDNDYQPFFDKVKPQLKQI